MIDIVLASYNGEKFIEEQIRSIQDNFDYNKLISRLIVVDDGSTDSTKAIVERLSQSDSKISLHDNISGSHGASENFAYGLTLAKADYIMLADQDDVWLEDKIQLSMQTMLKAEQTSPDMPVLVFSDKEIVDDDLSFICESYFKLKKIDYSWYKSFEQLLQQNVVSGCTMLINRKLCDIALPVPHDCYMHDWWIALFASKFGVIECIEKPLIKYRQHINNTIGAQQRSKVSLVIGFFRHLALFEERFLATVYQAKQFQTRCKPQDVDLAKETTDTLTVLSSVETQPIKARLKHFFSGQLTRSNLVGRFALFLTLLKIPVTKQNNI